MPLYFLYTMFAKVTQTFKGLILNPHEELKRLRDEPLEEAFIYFLAVAAVFVVLSAIVSVLMTVLSMHESTVFYVAYLFGYIFGAYIGCVIGMFIGAFILHAFIYCLGGRNGVEATIKAAIYSFTPLVLLGWIPVLGVIGSIWSLILEAIAIRELHDISTARAAIAVILTLLFITVMVVLFIVFLVIFILIIVQPSTLGIEESILPTM